jgi:hypothetical protein
MSGKRRSRPASSEPHAWIRSNILGLVAIFIALSGSAAAATVVIKHDSKGSTKAKASKKAKGGRRGPAGPAGAAGAQGVQGNTGAPGPGALRLQFNQLATDGQVHVLGTVNELTVSAACQHSGVSTLPLLFVYAQSSVAGAGLAGTSSETDDFGPVTTRMIATGVSTDAVQTELLALVPENGAGHLETSILHSTFFTANHAISLDLYGIANSAIDHSAVEVDSCEVHGTAVPAS